MGTGTSSAADAGRGKEMGLPHGARRLRHVVTFGEAMDSLSGIVASTDAMEMPIHIVIGCKLRDARKRLGITQEDLSSRINMPQSVISDIENGRGRGNGPTCATVQRIATAVGLRLALVPIVPDVSGQPPGR